MVHKGGQIGRKFRLVIFLSIRKMVLDLEIWPIQPDSYWFRKYIKVTPRSQGTILKLNPKISSNEITFQDTKPIVFVNNGYVIDALANLTCCIFCHSTWKQMIFPWTGNPDAEIRNYTTSKLRRASQEIGSN